MKVKTKIISVISGKGGTGKSLFTAVLGNCLSKEHCKVLLVDMDIHVRGLTILLSKYIDSHGLSVMDCLEDKYNRSINDYSISRFQECEIFPSVIDISQPLIKEIGKESIASFIQNLYKFVQGKYDIVLLDCRAGLDDSLVEIVKKSNFVISVSEDDDVCLQANLNLVSYLRYKENINHIYTVINKGRRIKEKKDIDQKINSVFDFNCIGVIPFDETIMEDYGKDRFWLTVYDTLYFYGIIKFWNNFREKTSMRYFIIEEKYYFGKSKIIQNGFFSSMSKVFRLYGFSLLIAGIVVPFVAEILMEDRISYMDELFKIISMMGILMISLSSRKFRSFLLAKDDDPIRKQ